MVKKFNSFLFLGNGTPEFWETAIPPNFLPPLQEISIMPSKMYHYQLYKATKINRYDSVTFFVEKNRQFLTFRNKNCFKARAVLINFPALQVKSRQEDKVLAEIFNLDIHVPEL